MYKNVIISHDLVYLERLSLHIELCLTILTYRTVFDNQQVNEKLKKIHIGGGSKRKKTVKFVQL